MSAEPAPLRRLTVVDKDSGEVVDPEIAALQARIATLEAGIVDLQKELSVKLATITRLKKDKIQERFNYARAEDVRRVHDYWNRRLGHEQALTADRFDAVRGRLEETNLAVVDGKARKVPVFKFPEDFKRAIDGAWFDPMTKVQRNGKIKKYDDLELIFRDASHMRDFIERAPGS
jgi:hypothetical protein